MVGNADDCQWENFLKKKEEKKINRSFKCKVTSVNSPLLIKSNAMDCKTTPHVYTSHAF